MCVRFSSRVASRSYRVLCAVRVTLCVSVIVRAVHQSSSKLGDTPLARLGLAVEPLQQTLQQNRALHRSTSDSHRHAPGVELYSSTALQSALHLYISTALQRSTLYILYTLPQRRVRRPDRPLTRGATSYCVKATCFLLNVITRL